MSAEKQPVSERASRDFRWVDGLLRVYYAMYCSEPERVDPENGRLRISTFDSGIHLSFDDRPTDHEYEKEYTLNISGDKVTLSLEYKDYDLGRKRPIPTVDLNNSEEMEQLFQKFDAWLASSSGKTEPLTIQEYASAVSCAQRRLVLRVRETFDWTKSSLDSGKIYYEKIEQENGLTQKTEGVWKWYRLPNTLVPLILLASNLRNEIYGNLKWASQDGGIFLRQFTPEVRTSLFRCTTDEYHALTVAGKLSDNKKEKFNQVISEVESQKTEPSVDQLMTLMGLVYFVV